MRKEKASLNYKTLTALLPVAIILFGSKGHCWTHKITLILLGCDLLWIYVCQSSDCFAQQVLTNTCTMHQQFKVFLWWLFVVQQILILECSLIWIYWPQEQDCRHHLVVELCVLFWCMRVLKLSQTCFVSLEFDNSLGAMDVSNQINVEVTRPASSTLNNNEAVFQQWSWIYRDKRQPGSMSELKILHGWIWRNNPDVNKGVLRKQPWYLRLPDKWL